MAFSCDMSGQTYGPYLGENVLLILIGGGECQEGRDAECETLRRFSIEPERNLEQRNRKSTTNVSFFFQIFLFRKNSAVNRLQKIQKNHEIPRDFSQWIHYPRENDDEHTGQIDLEQKISHTSLQLEIHSDHGVIFCG